MNRYEVFMAIFGWCWVGALLKFIAWVESPLMAVCVGLGLVGMIAWYASSEVSVNA